MKSKVILGIFIILLIISCSDTTSSEDISKMEILDILDEIESAFTFSDIESIMENYHHNFSHLANDSFYNFGSETIVWESRINSYSNIDFLEIDIQINGDTAIASFQFHLDDEIFPEPETYGDISYFYNSINGWVICGNNFRY